MSRGWKMNVSTQNKQLFRVEPLIYQKGDTGNLCVHIIYIYGYVYFTVYITMIKYG